MFLTFSLYIHYYQFWGAVSMRVFTTIISLVFLMTCSVAFAGVSGTSGPSKYSGANIKPVEDKPEDSQETSDQSQ